MTTAMVENTVIGPFSSSSTSSCTFPHYAAAAASGNKKSKDSSRWPSHSSADNWSTSPDNEPSSVIQSTTTVPTVTATAVAAATAKGKGDDEGLWSNRQQESWPPPSNNHWMSDEDSLSNSDPIADEITNELDGFSSDGNKTNERGSVKGGGASQDANWEELDPMNTDSAKTTKKPSPDGRDVQSPGNESLDGGQELLTSDGVWRSRNSMGSTSSINSAGSSSSWKNSGGSRIGGNYARSTSPRKQSRYDAHRSVSVSSMGGSRTSGSRFSSKKKPVLDIDDAMDSLHSEPSGWGNLPSPKQSGIDTGTEVWGIPDDVRQKMKKDHKPAVRGSAWSELQSNNAGGSDWNDDGTMTAGWNSSENGLHESYQQWGVNEAAGGSDTGWNIVVSKGKDRGCYADKVKMLVDMGFSPPSCEKALKVNNDNLEAALGDLLALTAIKDEEQHQELASSVPSTTPGVRPQKSSLSVPVTSGGSSDAVSPPLSMGLPSSTAANNPHYLIPHSSITPPTISPQPHQSQTPVQQWQQGAGLGQQRGGAPVTTLPSGLDLANLHQILNQQLTHYKLLKQRLTMQMSQVKSTALNPQQLQKQQQFLTANLNQVNSQIAVVHQQLVVVTQLMQQKQQQQQPPSDEKDGKEMGRYSETETAPTSLNDLSYPVQNISLDSTAISKTSARTLSRLQQIIGQENSDTMTSSQPINSFVDIPSVGTEVGGASIPPTSISEKMDVIATSIVAEETVSSSSSAIATAAGGGGSGGNSGFSSFTASGRFIRSVDEIPEFKPGVPWYPHSQSTQHQAQTYTKPSSGGVTTPTTPADFGLYSSDSTNDKVYPPSQYGRAASGFNPQYGGMYEQSNFGATNQSRFTSAPPPFMRSSSYSGSGYTNSSGGPPLYKQYSSNAAQQKLPPQQNFPPPARPHRPRVQSQSSFNGFSSNPIPITGSGITTPGYNSAGGRSNYRSQFSSGSSTQQNKWPFDGNPWGMPATSGSIWSMESTDSLLSSTTSGFNDWRSGTSGRKPSLPLQLSAPTSYIVLKNVSAQIDETSLREVCCEYGKVLTCSLNPFNETVLIRYSTKEEAALAKAGLEKNPSICGVFVTPSFASEMDIASFTDQRTPSNPSSMSLSSALDITVPSWPPPSHSTAPKKPTSLWGSNSGSVTSGSHSGGSSSGSTSVWSNGGGVLPGIASPWSISPATQPSQVNTSVAQDKEEFSNSTISASPPLSTFLPNGLF